MTDKEFIEITNKYSIMHDAAIEMGLSFSTFKRRAIKLGCYKPNPGMKGLRKSWLSERAIPLNDIFNGLYPNFQSYKLKQRLYKEGLKSNTCEICGICEWNGSPIQCELDHIDGNKNNHSYENLRILCPNCHSQTETFRFKRGKKNKPV